MLEYLNKIVVGTQYICYECALFAIGMHFLVVNSVSRVAIILAYNEHNK